MYLSRSRVSLISSFAYYILMKNFIIFPRCPWYRKKRFMIPLSLLIILGIAAILIGCILGTRSNITPEGMTFGVLFSSKANNSLFSNSGLFLLENILLYSTIVNIDMLSLFFMRIVCLGITGSSHNFELFYFSICVHRSVHIFLKLSNRVNSTFCGIWLL